MKSISLDTPIDLQLHTIHSDGEWIPEKLLDHLKGEGFGLAAITDHERPDMAQSYQALATEEEMPLLVAVEMITLWQNSPTDMLVYGFDPAAPNLSRLGDDLLKRQQDATRESFTQLCQQGYLYADKSKDEQEEILTTMLSKPAAMHTQVLYDLLEASKDGREKSSPVLMRETGFKMATNDIADVVEAAHQDGGVCIIAHPGRTDGFLTYDMDILDRIFEQFPLDGLEVYYPAHTPEQVEMYLAYAKKHKLLYSSGSDSHGPHKQLPIKYRAEQSQPLLERMGFSVK